MWIMAPEVGTARTQAAGRQQRNRLIGRQPCSTHSLTSVGSFRAYNWLRVSLGRQNRLKAAAKPDFQLLFPDRVKSSFLEGWNGWKPPWVSDSHAIGARIV